VAAIVIWIVYLIIRRRRGPGKTDASKEAGAGKPAPDTSTP
jgi:hypothetical protein